MNSHQMIAEYRHAGLTSDQIGLRAGVTGARIRQILRSLGMGTKPRPLTQRFLEKVTKTSKCWLWNGYLDPMGYGRINIGGDRIDRAHRVAYRLFVDASLPPAANVLHSCDNPRCVNPAHLRLGTPSDNALDRESRNRGKTRKLTPDEVLEIRARIVEGDSNLSLAVRYRVHRSTIERIRNGKKWRFLK